MLSDLHKQLHQEVLSRFTNLAQLPGCKLRLEIWEADSENHVAIAIAIDFPDKQAAKEFWDNRKPLARAAAVLGISAVFVEYGGRPFRPPFSVWHELIGD